MPDHDVVVFGATGYTGALTAEYLAANAPSETRWALAGRNREKLERLRERLGVDVPLLHGDVGDADSLRAVAEATKVVITTVGPYINYGEPLVAACAEAGTAYVDLTGEPEFVDRMYVRHHARAAETGARIVHACGFDSIPADLGALFTVEQLPEGVPLRVECFVRVGGSPSGGTVHSAITAFSRARHTAQAPSERRRAEGPAGGGRRVVTEIAGGDPGYGETSKMLAESALCLAHDDLPAAAGQVTTAVAMGDALIERLRRTGITFEVLEANDQ